MADSSNRYMNSAMLSNFSGTAEVPSLQYRTCVARVMCTLTAQQRAVAAARALISCRAGVQRTSCMYDILILVSCSDPWQRVTIAHASALRHGCCPGIWPAARHRAALGCVQLRQAQLVRAQLVAAMCWRRILVAPALAAAPCASPGRCPSSTAALPGSPGCTGARLKAPEAGASMQAGGPSPSRPALQTTYMGSVYALMWSSFLLLTPT